MIGTSEVELIKALFPEASQDLGQEIWNAEITGVAKNLKEDGVDLSIISKATGLSLKEIEEL